MVLQLQIWAFWLFQEAEGIQFDVRSVWGNMGTMAKCVVGYPVHHVRLVHRRHD